VRGRQRRPPRHRLKALRMESKGLPVPGSSFAWAGGLPGMMCLAWVADCWCPMAYNKS
jgi:hypothetical protein